jgi:hypothetical protein
MAEPRDVVQRLEAAGQLPDGNEERFSGFGVMAVPFSTGHLLAMRHFHASSIGPGYTSIWHRSPEGRWVFYANIDPTLSCNRFFGQDVEETHTGSIDLEWMGPRSFRIRAADGRLSWEIELAPTFGTRLMTRTGGLIPDRLWRQPAVLSMMQPVASKVLGIGRVALRGTTSNGQAFLANPKLLWSIPRSRAEIDGVVHDQIQRLPDQAQLGDFWLPQAGLFAIGSAFYEPFDPQRHRAAVRDGDR